MKLSSKQISEVEGEPKKNDDSDARRVYVAGRLNDMAVDYIKNMHRMMKTAEEVRKAGFSVYIPCIDILMGMFTGNWEYEDYFNNSQPWLKISDAVFIVPGWEDSEGTQREIKTAEKLGIPVFYNLKDLLRWHQTNEYR